MIPQRLIPTLLTTLLILAARVSADTTPAKTTIAVTPFEVLAPAGSEWMGRAMQEGIATNLQKSAGLASTIVAGLAPADAASAIALAKPANPKYVIFGSIQIVDTELRVTAQIISASTGQSFASLKSDGSQRDLFNIEDQLAERFQKMFRPAQKPLAKAQAPTIELIGPLVSSGASRYFDGNLMAALTTPERFRDDYNRYYYQSYDTSWSWWGGCYGGWGGSGWWGWAGPGWWGGLVYPVAAPISTW